MGTAPIRIEVFDNAPGYPQLKLRARSRVDLVKVYTLEHNVHVQKVGKVGESDFSRMRLFHEEKTRTAPLRVLDSGAGGPEEETLDDDKEEEKQGLAELASHTMETDAAGDGDGAE